MEKYKDIKAIFFDLDGTLVDLVINYEKLRTELKKLFLCYGIKTDFKLILKSIEMAYKIKDNKEANILMERAYDIVNKYEILGAKKARKISGADTLLKKLKSLGLKIVIISRNSRKSIQIALKKTKIDKYVDLIVGREDVKKVKPHPEMIKKALKYLRLKPSEVLIAGDHLYDVIAAKNVGALSIGIQTKNSDFSKCYPDFIISDLKQILKII